MTNTVPAQVTAIEDELRDIDPQTLALWNAQKRAQMVYQRRVARLLREQAQATRRTNAALAAGSVPTAPLPEAHHRGR